MRLIDWLSVEKADVHRVVVVASSRHCIDHDALVASARFPAALRSDGTWVGGGSRSGSCRSFGER